MSNPYRENNYHQNNDGFPEAQTIEDGGASFHPSGTGLDFDEGHYNQSQNNHDYGGYNYDQNGQYYSNPYGDGDYEGAHYQRGLESPQYDRIRGQNPWDDNQYEGYTAERSAVEKERWEQDQRQRLLFQEQNNGNNGGEPEYTQDGRRWDDPNADFEEEQGNFFWDSGRIAHAANALAAPLLGGHQQTNEWDVIPDLDKFLSDIYSYYEKRGLQGIQSDNLTHLVSLGFTLIFSFFLAFLVNWDAVMDCQSEQECSEVSFFHDSPFSDMSFYHYILLFYFVGGGMYFAANCYVVAENLKSAAEIQRYYKERLNIQSDEVLASMAWSDIVVKLIHQQQQSPFCVKQATLNALEITNIIMRDENYFVALANHSILHKHLPKFVPRRLAYTDCVMYWTRMAINWSMFDAYKRVKRTDPEELARFFQILGLCQLLALGPIFLFVLVYFFLKYLEDFRSSRSSPVDRQWNQMSEYFFREYNELPHQFRQRMEESKKGADALVENGIIDTTQYAQAVRRCIKYIFGSFLAVLVAMAAYDERPMLFVKLGGKNLIWYLAACSLIVAACGNPATGAVVQTYSRHLQQATAALYMEKVILGFAKSSHYIPSAWRNTVFFNNPHKIPRGMTNSVYSDSNKSEEQQHTMNHRNSSSNQHHQNHNSSKTYHLSVKEKTRICEAFVGARGEVMREYYYSKIQILAEDLIGVLVCPFIFLWSLPKAAPEICSAFETMTYASPNLGDWCKMGCLSVGKLDPALSRYGKLEKSALNFVLTYRDATDIDEEDRRIGEQRMERGSAVVMYDPVERQESFDIKESSAWGRARDEERHHSNANASAQTSAAHRSSSKNTDNDNTEQDEETFENNNINAPRRAHSQPDMDQHERNEFFERNPNMASSFNEHMMQREREREQQQSNSQLRDNLLGNYGNTNPDGSSSLWGYPMDCLQLCYEIEQLGLQQASEFSYLPGEIVDLKECCVDKIDDDTFKMSIPSYSGHFSSILEEGNTFSLRNSSHFFWAEVYLKLKEEENMARREQTVPGLFHSTLPPRNRFVPFDIQLPIELTQRVRNNMNCRLM